MREAYPFLFNFENVEDGVILRGGECNTLVLIPIIYRSNYINVVNMICMIPSVEIKDKALVVNS